MKRLSTSIDSVNRKGIKDGWHGARLGLATSPTPCRMWEDPKGKEIGLASKVGVWDSLPNPTANWELQGVCQVLESMPMLRSAGHNSLKVFGLDSKKILANISFTIE